MRFKNTTDIPDAFLRKMVTWVAKEVGLPRAAIRSISFENRSWAHSGRCWTRSGRVLCGIGRARHFPHRDARDRDDYVEADRYEGLVYITAHELWHLVQWLTGRIGGRLRIEKPARYAGYNAVLAFREERDELLAYWDAERPRPKAPVPATRKERNCLAAMAKLQEWEKKAKLANAKLKLYRDKVRRYERQGLVAAQGGKAKGT